MLYHDYLPWIKFGAIPSINVWTFKESAYLMEVLESIQK